MTIYGLCVKYRVLQKYRHGNENVTEKQIIFLLKKISWNKKRIANNVINSQKVENFPDMLN